MSNLLSQSVVAFKEAENLRDPFAESEKQRIEITNVRMDIQNKSTNSGTPKESLAQSATLFFFQGISKVEGSFADCPLTLHDTVEFDGQSWNVTGLRKLYDAYGLPHHWEVSLG